MGDPRRRKGVGITARRLHRGEGEGRGRGKLMVKERAEIKAEKCRDKRAELQGDPPSGVGQALELAGPSPRVTKP